MQIVGQSYIHIRLWVETFSFQHSSSPILLRHYLFFWILGSESRVHEQFEGAEKKLSIVNSEKHFKKKLSPVHSTRKKKITKQNLTLSKL